ncbi:ribonuclease-like protein P complex subunit Pop4 [Usnea florida]
MAATTPNQTHNHIAHTLLQAHHPAPLANTIFTDKILHKPLHLRPTSPDPTSQNARRTRRLQRLRKKEKTSRRRRPKVKPLSAKEKRDSGIYEIPKEARKYEMYVPLRGMWVGYMWEVLGMEEGGGKGAFVTGAGAGGKVASADFHGAEVRVVRSRCVGMVGLEGIVVRDTKFTFQVVTRGDELKIIPKRHTVFRFEIPQPGADRCLEEGTAITETKEGRAPLVFELHGSQFENRAPDRATKKFKQRYMNDL